MTDIEFVTAPGAVVKRVEFFIAAPRRPATLPAFIYVHGHQAPERPGGRAPADAGVLDALAAAGVLAVAVSQPGYGGSDGPPDYCGPATQAAIMAVIDRLTRRGDAASGRVALIGASRGAIASAVAATRTEALGALVLSAGFYDFEAGYRSCRWKGIKRHIETEAGTTRDAFIARSALHRAAEISCPTLIMHGAQDDRYDPTHAERFARALREHGRTVELRIFANQPHRIAPRLFWGTANPFIGRCLGLSLPRALR